MRLLPVPLVIGVVIIRIVPGAVPLVTHDVGDNSAVFVFDPYWLVPVERLQIVPLILDDESYDLTGSEVPDVHHTNIFHKVHLTLLVALVPEASEPGIRTTVRIMPGIWSTLNLYLSLRASSLISSSQMTDMKYATRLTVVSRTIPFFISPTEC